jgi:hypothetical protein
MTPRTDAATTSEVGSYYFTVSAAFARELETDLREARELLSEVLRYSNDLPDELHNTSNDFLSRMEDKDK